MQNKKFSGWKFRLIVFFFFFILRKTAYVLSKKEEKYEYGMIFKTMIFHSQPHELLCPFL